MRQPTAFEEMVARVRALADRIDLGEPLDPVRRKLRRRALIRRGQAAALILAIVAATGGGAFALVRTVGIGHRGRVSVSGAAAGRIAYVSKVTGDDEIWVANPDGTGRTNLTRDARANDFAPAWSPDGTKIAFSKWRGTTDRGIFVMAGDGRGLTRLSTGSDFGAAWSPDGTRIAFSRGHGIWVMQADGSHPHQVTHSGGGDRDPTWSPDGSRIAFSREDRSIVVVRADGSGLSVITDGGSDVQPAWSPDGSRIAFQRHDDLFVMAPDGSDLRKLTSGRGTVLSRQPGWSPEGTLLVYERDEGSSQTLALIALDGSGGEPLPIPGGETFAMAPSWQPIPST